MCDRSETVHHCHWPMNELHTRVRSAREALIGPSTLNPCMRGAELSSERTRTMEQATLI